MTAIGWIGFFLNLFAVAFIRRRAKDMMSHDLHVHFERQMEQVRLINAFCIYSMLLFTIPTTIILIGTALGIPHTEAWWRTARVFVVVLWGLNSGANLILLAWKNSEFRSHLKLSLQMRSNRLEFSPTMNDIFDENEL